MDFDDLESFSQNVFLYLQKSYFYITELCVSSIKSKADLQDKWITKITLL